MGNIHGLIMRQIPIAIILNDLRVVVRVDRRIYIFDFLFGFLLDFCKVDWKRAILDWIVDVVHLVNDWLEERLNVILQTVSNVTDEAVGLASWRDLLFVEVWDELCIDLLRDGICHGDVEL